MVVEINWNKLVNLLVDAKSEIVLIMPSIHEEWVCAIEKNENKSNLEIKICIENSEEVIRNGYGDFKSIDKLKKLNAQIKECEGLRIYFISIDCESYFVFLESRIIAGDPKGLNAISLEYDYAVKIINQFFPIDENLIEKISNNVLSQPLQEEQFQIVKKGIENNPPSEPDLKRQITTYTSKFQYAEIHFEGANIQTKTVTIPPGALPFKDAELKKRMKTRFNLFTEKQTEKWQELLNMKKAVEKIRLDFLKPCNLKKERSILENSKKKAFNEAYEILKNKISNDIIQIADEVQTAINTSKDILKDEMTIFLFDNPPDDVKDIKDLNLRERIINDYVTKILVKTNIPTAHSLISKIKLDIQFADITIEDLQNQELLKWFKGKNLITDKDAIEIATFKKAYEIKI